MGTSALSACQCNYRSVKAITYTRKKVSGTRCASASARAHGRGERKREWGEEGKNDRARITHCRAVIAARGNRAAYTRLHRNDAIDISPTSAACIPCKYYRAAARKPHVYFYVHAKPHVWSASTNTAVRLTSWIASANDSPNIGRKMFNTSCRLRFSRGAIRSWRSNTFRALRNAVIALTSAYWY